MNNQLKDGFQHIRQLTDRLAFEEVISWVYQAPDPQPQTWWQRWWRQWRN